MLSEEEKARIVEIESFRKEIRDTLAKPGERKGGPLWTFLNSQIGLLIVTAALITPAGALFTHLQQEVVAHRKAADAAEALDFELGYRLSQVLMQLYELTDKKAPRASPLSSTTPDIVRTVLASLNEPEPKLIRPLAGEYKKLGIEELILERKRNTNDSRIKAALDSRLAAVLGKRLLEGDLLDINEKAGYIIAELMMPEWKKGAFYFTDCIRQAPFC